jgi:ribonuclease R
MSSKKVSSKKQQDYAVSIPERQQILEFLQEANKPRSLKHIAEAMGMVHSDERAALNKRLKAMLRDGEIIKNRREGYGLVAKMDLLRGTVIGHGDGYGFLRPDNRDEDLFLPVKEMRSLLHGDRVLVRIAGTNRKNQSEAAVVEILERANTQVVGRYFREGKIGYVTPDNSRLHQDVFIPSGYGGKAKSGQYVVAAITRQPDRHTQPVGKVIEILEQGSPVEMATDIAIRAYAIPWQWPDEVTEEIAGMGMEFADRKAPRKDLRELDFVTIDGEDARDFDDAVFCARTAAGWKLYVAIADVSSFVLPGTALDMEAAKRGTSVYFLQRVIPMLPEILSNDLCSLKPGIDRFCMVCEMDVDSRGSISQSTFYQAVIKSSRRMTYTEMAAVIDAGEDKTRKQSTSLIDTLLDLHELYRLMHKGRQKRGVLDFQTTESYMEFNEQGRVENVRLMIRNDAHRLIEEFMLAANISAAALLLQHEIPVLFRNHDRPTQEKLADVHEFLAGFGLQLDGGKEPVAADYARLLDQVKTREDAHLFETVLLRSMALAVYEDTNKGHFGLAFEAYTHFTSPIRRYPDLLVHRAIRHIISKAPYPYTRTEMHSLGESCSMAERRAEEASRDVLQRMKCEFMQDKIGELFTGTVSAVTAFGLFVELDEIFIEGLLHVTALPNDYYHFDAVGRRMTGERTGKVYRLGDRIKIKVVRVAVEDKKIDFDFVNESEPGMVNQLSAL